MQIYTIVDTLGIQADDFSTITVNDFRYRIRIKDSFSQLEKLGGTSVS